LSKYFFQSLVERLDIKTAWSMFEVTLTKHSIHRPPFSIGFYFLKK
jgi:hypothetical protein